MYPLGMGGRSSVSFFNFTWSRVVCNVVFVSAVQECESAISAQVSPPSHGHSCKVTGPCSQTFSSGLFRCTG